MALPRRKSGPGWARDTLARLAVPLRVQRGIIVGEAHRLASSGAASGALALQSENNVAIRSTSSFRTCGAGASRDCVFMKEETKISRERMVELLNEDLAREYQAIIAYVIYSQTIKGAEYNHIAQELEKHAGEELQHAINIAKQIDYFNGEPTNKPKEVKVSDDPKKMLQFDLENERQTLMNYRQRIQQADAMGEFALGEVLREIIAQEQEHLQDLADALGIDTPKIE